MARHMGATSGRWLYSHKVWCYYDRKSTGYSTSTSKELSPQQQENLNFKFMLNRCNCMECVSQRERRKRAIESLKKTSTW